MFPFHMPTLEYRNKTWSWYDFIEALKKDAVRVIFANTGALVREKIFQQKRKTVAGGPGNSSLGQQIDNVSDTAFSSMGGGDAQSDISTEETIKSTKPQSKRFFSGLFRKQQQSALSPSSEATFATNRLLEPSENGSLSSFGSGPDGHFRSVSEGTGTSGLVGSSTKGDSQEDVERESRLHDRGRLLFGKHYPLPPPTSIRA